MDGAGVGAFIIAILIIAILVFVMFFATGKRKHHFNKEDYQIKFLTIENGLKKENSSTFIVSILNADKLLDRAMTEMGAPGKTMGEKLKKIGGSLSDVNAVWKVHKLRNSIAHETDFDITYRQAASALSIYKQALKDLGAI